MNVLFRIVWVYFKYYTVKSNLYYEKIKEPWRFFSALALIMPSAFTMFSDVEPLYKILGIFWLFLLMMWRFLWLCWLSKSAGGKE